MKKNKTLQVYSDPGHAWVKVSRSDKTFMKIADKISCFSYQLNDNVYLEEDDDLGTYIDQLKKDGYSYTFKYKHTNDDSRIRKYEPYWYNPNYVPAEKTQTKDVNAFLVFYISTEKYILKPLKSMRAATRVGRNLWKKYDNEIREARNNGKDMGYLYSAYSINENHGYIGLGLRADVHENLKKEIEELKK